MTINQKVSVDFLPSISQRSNPVWWWTVTSATENPTSARSTAPLSTSSRDGCRSRKGKAALITSQENPFCRKKGVPVLTWNIWLNLWHTKSWLSFPLREKKCLTAAQWRPKCSINDIRTHTQLHRKISEPFDCQTSVRYHTSMLGPPVLSHSRHQTVKEVSLLCNQVLLRSPGSELWENGRYGQEQKLNLPFYTVNTL